MTGDALHFSRWKETLDRLLWVEHGRRARQTALVGLLAISGR
jgi:hypothetical protein